MHCDQPFISNRKSALLNRKPWSVVRSFVLRCGERAHFNGKFVTTVTWSTFQLVMFGLHKYLGFVIIHKVDFYMKQFRQYKSKSLYDTPRER